MRNQTRRMLAVNLLYALIPVLLLVLPLFMSNLQMQAYGLSFSVYMIVLEVGVIAVPALLYFLTPDGRGAASVFGRSAKNPGAPLLLVLPLSFCAYFFINGVTLVWMAVLHLVGMTQTPQSVPAPQTVQQLGVALLVIALVPALAEEFFFRGVLQPALHKHMKPWQAVVLGGCMFALIHGQMLSMPGHVLLGIGLCWVMYATRNIWYGILWHFMQNGLAMLISFASGYMLQMTQSMPGMDAAQQSADALTTPIMLMGGIAFMVMFGAGTALFGMLLWYTTRQRRAGANDDIARQERAPDAPDAPGAPGAVAWLPLIVALGCIVFMYVTSGREMLGVGL